jgi:hypothetical protein
MEVRGQLHTSPDLSPQKELPTHFMWRWVGPRNGLDPTQTRKISCLCRESNPDSSAVPPVARLYTDWTIELPVL